ncbi:CD1375 family protein [Intestinimonas butyriciproducens]|nr:CD1375 family protein [Intestinimonas butyriciproducens]MDY3616798.1 CD1375 family protein [Intestinimonas butyriciproducens]
MAKLYADLIQKGLKTIDDVHLRWRDEVQALLEEAQV